MKNITEKTMKTAVKTTMKTTVKTTVKMSTLGAIAFGMALAASAPVNAKGGAGKVFDQMDLNSDGYLDVAELKTAQDARFEAMDTDRDGAVSQEEMAIYRKKIHAEFGKRGEGKLGGKYDGTHDSQRARKDEYKHSGKDGAAVFKSLDSNNDGALSQSEFAEVAKKRPNQKKWRSKNRHNRMMAHMDVNKDGKLTRNEIGNDHIERIVRRLDKDGDGRISKKEASKLLGRHRKSSE